MSARKGMTKAEAWEVWQAARFIAVQQLGHILSTQNLAIIDYGEAGPQAFNKWWAEREEAKAAS